MFLKFQFHDISSLSPCQNDSGVEMTIADAISLASPEPEMVEYRVMAVGGAREGAYIQGEARMDRRLRTKGRMPTNRKCPIFKLL